MSGDNPEQTAQSTEAMTVTRYTYRYHNDSVNVLNILLLALVLLIAILGFFIFVQLGTNPKPMYFKLNAQQQIIDPVPLDQEGIGTAALLNWVNELVMKAFSFNYSNVQKQTAKLTPYLTDQAMQIYNNLLITDEQFQNIQLNKFVLSVIPKQAPEIIVSKAFQDRYAWQIELPVTLLFSNASIKTTQDITLDFLIWRVPETESELGIMVATFTYRITGRSGIQSIKRANI